MNESRLKTIFKNYISKFDQITYVPHGEIYKWEIAHDFKSSVDDALASPEEVFLEKMKQAVSLADNLLSNQYELPGGAICEYIKREREHMRRLLTDLFSDDGGDLEARQRKIDNFSAECNRLKTKYFPDSFKFEIGQRAVMVLLGLYDPDGNYLYKPMQANEFADCVEFYDDFGPSTHFKLPTYYRMCDELVAAMRADDELMAKHNSIYDSPQKPLHKDKNLHILAFDIIYSATNYHLYDNINYDHISSKERKDYLDNCQKAEQLAEAVEHARLAFDMYQEAIAVYSDMLRVGKTVIHKRWGGGTVIQYNDTSSGGVIRVSFPDYPDGKSFEAAKSVVGGFLVPDVADLTAINAKYRTVINKGEVCLREELKRAEEALHPFEKYLR